MLPALNHLIVSAAGVSLFRGDGSAAFFEDDGTGGFLRPAGSFSSLVENPDGTYTLTDRRLNRSIYASSGLLTERQDPGGNPTGASCNIGPGNRLLSDGTYDYEYDNEGNRTRRTEIATGNFVVYNWDHRQRLTGVTVSLRARPASELRVKTGH